MAVSLVHICSLLFLLYPRCSTALSTEGQNYCGAEKNECPNQANYTDLMIPYSDAITAYDRFVTSIEKSLNAGGTPESNRERIYADKDISASVNEFDTNVGLAYNNSRTAEAVASSIVDCLLEATVAIKAKITCYTGLMTETLVESAGVNGQFNSIEKEFKTAKTGSPDYPAITAELVRMRSRHNELNYRVAYIEDQKKKQQQSLNETFEQRNRARDQVNKFTYIAEKLFRFHNTVSYASEPSSLWSHYSVKNLLEVEELVDPMREIASLIAKHTGKPTNNRLKLITDAKIDALKHKFLKGNSTTEL